MSTAEYNNESRLEPCDSEKEAQMIRASGRIARPAPNRWKSRVVVQR